jgi:hypothetical protein
MKSPAASSAYHYPFLSNGEAALLNRLTIPPWGRPGTGTPKQSPSRLSRINMVYISLRLVSPSPGRKATSACPHVTALVTPFPPGRRGTGIAFTPAVEHKRGTARWACLLMGGRSWWPSNAGKSPGRKRGPRIRSAREPGDLPGAGPNRMAWHIGRIPAFASRSSRRQHARSPGRGPYCSLRQKKS